jgi:hypothetical protein
MMATASFDGRGSAKREAVLQLLVDNKASIDAVDQVQALLLLTTTPNNTRVATVTCLP